MAQPSRPPSSRAARPAFCSERARHRTADHGDLGRFGLNDRRSRSSRARPSATITASPGAAIACSSWAVGRRPRALRRFLENRPIRDLAAVRRARAAASSPPGSATATSAGRLISFRRSPKRRNCHDLASPAGAALPRCSSPLSRSPRCWRRQPRRNGPCSTRRTMRRTC
jgi:hypothetical protein